MTSSKRPVWGSILGPGHSLACTGVLAVAAAALGLALGSSGTSYASSPAPVWGAASSVALPIGGNVPASDPRVTITSVSCWSAGNCAAVGTYVVQGGGTSSNFVAALLLTELNHVWQPSLQGIDPGVGQFELTSVSCAGAGTCVAVGSYRTGHANDIFPDVFTATGGVWSQTGSALQIPGDKITNGAQQVATLASVSCESAGNCVAVGQYNATYGSVGQVSLSGMITTETGGAWHPAVTIVPPGDSAGPQEVQPSSVSCAPTGECDAVGNYMLTSGSGSIRFSLAGTGGTLSAAAATLPLPSGAYAGGSLLDFPSISCGSAGCAATNPYFQGASGRPGGTFALESKASGGAWAEVPGLVGPSPYTASSNVNAVACGPSACAAVGNASSSPTGGAGAPAMAWDQTGSGWGTTGQVIQPFSGPNLNPAALSCASAGNCTTVGVFNPIAHSSTYYGFAASEVDGTWQPAVQLQMAFGSTAYGPDPFFAGVSCPDTGDCAAAGYYYDASGHQQAFVIDATPGSATTTPTGTGTNTTPTGTGAGTGTGTGTGTNTTPTTPAAAPPHPNFGVPRISGFSVLLPVSCSGAGTCSLALTLTATETLQGSKLLAITAASRKPKHHLVVLGSTSVSVPSHTTVTANVALNPVGKRLLKQRRALPVTLTAKQAGTVLTRQRLKFKRH